LCHMHQSIYHCHMPARTRLYGFHPAALRMRLPWIQGIVDCGYIHERSGGYAGRVAHVSICHYSVFGNAVDGQKLTQVVGTRGATSLPPRLFILYQSAMSNPSSFTILQRAGGAKAAAVRRLPSFARKKRRVEGAAPCAPHIPAQEIHLTVRSRGPRQSYKSLQ
jgi:hypothetical protein